jgi:hypothetical protein
MLPSRRIWATLCCLLCIPFLLSAQTVRIVTNHVGYEDSGAKRAIIVGEPAVVIDGFQLVNVVDHTIAYTGKPILAGPVDKWRHWVFWTMDFGDFRSDGMYQLQVSYSGRIITSYPFEIGKSVLARSTISDLVYYFKGQRCSGLLDKADHHLLLAGGRRIPSMPMADGMTPRGIMANICPTCLLRLTLIPSRYLLPPGAY